MTWSKVDWFKFIGGFVTGLIIILTFTMVLFNVEIAFNEQMNDTYIFCCDGFVCSDTYYDEERDLCVLTLSGETYKPNKLLGGGEK